MTCDHDVYDQPEHDVGFDGGYACELELLPYPYDPPKDELDDIFGGDPPDRWVDDTGRTIHWTSNHESVIAFNCKEWERGGQ